LFWCLIRYINGLEALGGSATLAQCVARDTSGWDDTLDALIVGINQVSFSGWKPEECIAIGNELLSWKQKGLSESEGALFFFNIYWECYILVSLHVFGALKAFRVMYVGSEDGKYIWALRLKATLDRARRLTEEYSEALLSIFPENVMVRIYPVIVFSDYCLMDENCMVGAHTVMSSHLIGMLVMDS
jgi:phosphoglucan,water dikinase